ncbi:hypothetical protein N7456_001942 [Penicillium angulare]|uniref:Uncharacterized protein n=1 Tax=Penicillium angulare TaxID=116970 RepID=A0A9W9G7C7_9EURO|nr:hypothetical protein N7456_001942 [Penicillium angulare]
MDPDTAHTERLKKLQMADLGVARRDFISARDDRKNIPHVRIEDLEAARQSNIPGTAAQKEAQKNKRILSEWTDLHKTAGDRTKSDSQLDSLMDGQSHRANLNLTFHHNTPQTFNFGKTASTFKENHPLPPVSLGRGGEIDAITNRDFKGTRTPNVRRAITSRPERTTPADISSPQAFLEAYRLTSAKTQSSSEPSLKRGLEIASPGLIQPKAKALPVPETPTPPVRAKKALPSPTPVSAQTKEPSETVISSLMAKDKTSKTSKQPEEDSPVEISLALPLPKRRKESIRKATAAPQESSGILLDIGGQRETTKSPQFMSPALADLKGLDFCFETEQTVGLRESNAQALFGKKDDDGLNKLVRAMKRLRELMNDLTMCQDYINATLFNFDAAPGTIKAAPVTPSKPTLGDSFKNYREPPKSPSPSPPDTKEPSSEESKEDYVLAPELQTPCKLPKVSTTTMFQKQVDRSAFSKENMQNNVFFREPIPPKPVNALSRSIHAPKAPMQSIHAPAPRPLPKFGKAKTIGVQPYLPPGWSKDSA